MRAKVPAWQAALWCFTCACTALKHGEWLLAGGAATCCALFAYRVFLERD